MRRTRRLAPLALLTSAVVLLGACAAPTATPEVTGGTTTQDGHDHDNEEAAPADGRPTEEAAGPSPRLAVTYDGGVLIVDALSLEVLADFPAEGFIRVNPAGDGRHLFLTLGEEFRLLDTGAFSEAHGDHSHSYTTDPLLTDVAIAADHPGHVVTHADRTVLFADGTGEITVLDPHELAAGAQAPVLATTSTPQAHHGVAVVRTDDSLLHTIGDSQARSGVVLLDAEGDEVARAETCPGVHGETVAAEETVVFGCENGALVVTGSEFTHAAAPDAYGRIGNLAGSDASPVVLGDYKSDPDADLERPTRVSLIDTRTAEIRLVDLGVSYTFRSLARGPGGEALVLGTDGTLRVIDPEAGTVTSEIPVTGSWTEPEQWQDPRPTLRVEGSFAYVTEPATSTVFVVDLQGAAVIDSAVLPVVPNELSSVTG
ncbi:hypothetical protein EXU48_23700 [Occultella glacieicola]|uniref:Secreted protein n=1 Tax=Occultella glacieicola TaxID=2518684 RepID=A0ABY2DXI9_9MICO|nr:zinc metallochaperone AztD [Occultella glacieicola]TDE88292.1 hypothetical protein EXU48_23700 [Occultella glacieicola]